MGYLNPLLLEEIHIFCQGHWSCSAHVCEPSCDFCEDDPVPPCCGDEDCDFWYGENEQSCMGDCA